MGNVIVISENNKHLKKLTSSINQKSIFNVKSFAKTSELNGANECNLENVQLILLNLTGKADPPWDLWVLRHRFFGVPIIVEVEKDTTQERAYRLTQWGAWYVVGTDENISDVIEKAVTSLSLS